ncbi:MAG TPA: hypothetical protein VLA52_02620 [Thermohalobaculum sp.]|nr:hypothetical protein [Thermohalobaculum sp.]
MKHVVVVYQFGKVASTSLVATLNALPDVEAVQAHFLGRASLKEMVDLIVDPGTGDYFHRHQVGQFIENARTTRLIQAHRQGLAGDAALSIITLCRDPFDWFRSSLIQDMAGYRPVLEGLQASAGDDGDEDSIRKALERMFALFAGIIDEFGGIDALIERQATDKKCLSGHAALSASRGLLAMFYMMLRPFSWFEAHYRTAIGHDLTEFRDIGGAVLYRDAGWSKLILLRYEDLGDQIGIAGRKLGIGPVEELVRENLSGGKEMAQTVAAAFRSDAAGELHARFRATAYARRFGYA